MKKVLMALCIGAIIVGIVSCKASTTSVAVTPEGTKIVTTNVFGQKIISQNALEQVPGCYDLSYQ